MTVDSRTLEFLRQTQHGVLARRQCLGAGLTENDLRRMLRRREMRLVHPGVYVDHTGPLTWTQRQWAAVLACWPAALCRESAVAGERADAIQVAVARGRTVAAPTGVRVHRTAGLDDRVDWRASPPRIRVEHAVIDVMSDRLRNDDIAGAYALLCRACFAATTAARIARTLGTRERVAGRATIDALLSDLATGACSVLERGYLHRVERAHGLPPGRRQRTSRASGRRTDQDVRYEEYGLVVELDGRGTHDSVEAWDDDARRDLAELAVGDAVTARVTYGLVFREACQTARWIGALLARQGWKGTLLRCPDCPPSL